MKINLPVVLTILFVTLKLVGVIAWSWLWVLAPLWIPFAVWLVVAAVVVILAFAGHKVTVGRKSNPVDDWARFPRP